MRIYSTGHDDTKDTCYLGQIGVKEIILVDYTRSQLLHKLIVSKATDGNLSPVVRFMQRDVETLVLKNMLQTSLEILTTNNCRTETLTSASKARRPTLGMVLDSSRGNSPSKTSSTFLSDSLSL